MIKDTRVDHLDLMYDEATLKRYKDQHEIVMNRPRIKDSLVELKSFMKEFEISGDEK